MKKNMTIAIFVVGLALGWALKSLCGGGGGPAVAAKNGRKKNE